MIDRFTLLIKIAALGVSLGVFQFLASQGVFLSLRGWLIYLPFLMIFAFCFFALKKTLSLRNKKNGIILVTLTILGVFAASFLGHKTFKQYEKLPGVIKIE